MPITGPHHDCAATLAPPAQSSFVGWLRRDPLLLGVTAGAGLLVLYQAVITVLYPSWLGAATDWSLAVLAWPEAAVPALVSFWLRRARRPGALAWALVSTAALAYALSQTLRLLFDQFLLPGRVPSPWWPDLLYLLQYPFLFLALLYVPGVSRLSQRGISRIKVLLDGLLLALAGTTLSWYFLLEPIYRQSAQSSLGKAANLSSPIADLALFFGLVFIFTRQRPDYGLRMALRLLLASIILSMIGDAWYAYLNLYNGYQDGSPLDTFLVACNLLIPLAALVHVRLPQQPAASDSEEPGKDQRDQSERARDLRAALQILFPFAAALLASGLIVLRAIQSPNGRLSLIVAVLVSSLLLLLVIVRQGITTLENEQLRRDQEAARAEEAALHEANARMDAFLGIASHELRTPLTTLKLHLQLARRRFRRLEPQITALAPGTINTLLMLDEQLAQTESQTRRLTRLVNELLDSSRIQSERLELHRAPAELAAIVSEAVEEQRQAAPERTIRLLLSAESVVPVFVDADRIGQVVTNFLINALKYSLADCPVEAGVRVEEKQGYVWVRDQGPGLPPAEQAHIWERFYRAPGIVVQSGSGVGLGLGLYISKTILEQHGGKIGVNSAPGEGATFWFTLPLALHLARSTDEDALFGQEKHPS
jgi:signal transduction histidine kinase